jgi:hypothetical protein
MRKKALPGHDEPLRHPDHPKPRTRRQLLAQGFIGGAGTVVAPSLFGLFSNPMMARAALSPDLESLKADCGISVSGTGRIPFICIDLAGGANMAGSNALIGGPGGQMDFLSTDGYRKLGLPGDMIPSLGPQFINTDLGLAFHFDSAFVRGILDRVSPTTAANVNGAVIPARSDNDTGNNPHNPLYGIARTGTDGSLVTLIGSENSDSGGNSDAPADMIDTSIRPTKVDRPSDATGLVGDAAPDPNAVPLLSQEDNVAVMEAIHRISDMKLGQVDTKVTTDDVIKELVRCGYLQTADIADRFSNAGVVDPSQDPLIVGPAGIFSQQEFDDEREFRKAASVMKLVIQGFAGAGCIEMGGYDYHGGRRARGEVRDFRAGRVMGACLEFASRVGQPLMLYIFSDGSLSSDGGIDDTVEGRGKGEWDSDNSSTAASIMLVYNPNGRPAIIGATPEEQARHQQIGYMRSSASVETASSPAANQVNLLVQTVILNYMALHGEQGMFPTVFPTHGLGNSVSIDALTAFEPLV